MALAVAAIALLCLAACANVAALAEPAYFPISIAFWAAVLLLAASAKVAKELSIYTYRASVFCLLDNLLLRGFCELSTFAVGGSCEECAGVTEVGTRVW